MYRRTERGDSRHFLIMRRYVAMSLRDKKDLIKDSCIPEI